MVDFLGLISHDFAALFGGGEVGWAEGCVGRVGLRYGWVAEPGRWSYLIACGGGVAGSACLTAFLTSTWPVTICECCWMAQGAVPKVEAKPMVVRMVVLRRPGRRTAIEAGAFEAAGGAFGGPDGGLGEEGADEDERDGGDDAGHERVPPRASCPPRMAGREWAQAAMPRLAQDGEHDAADGAERLGVAEDFFAAFLCLGESSAGCATAATNSTQTPMKMRQRQKRSSGRVVANRRRRAGRQRVEKDGPGEDAASAQEVGEVAAQEAEGSADVRRGRRRVESLAQWEKFSPVGSQESGRCARGMEGGDGGLDDEREHQQLVGVKEEADAGDEADEPLHGSESGGGCGLDV